MHNPFKKSDPFLKRLNSRLKFSVGVVSAFWHLFKKGKLDDYIAELLKNELEEVNDFTAGKQSFNKFRHNSNRLLKDFFVPHEGNDHKPKALRPKILASYAVVAIGLKVIVSGFLFLSYPNPAQFAAIVSDRMIEMINQSRNAAGVTALTVDPALVDAATRKGQDMMDRDYFAHDTPEGQRPWEWINRSQYDYVYAGENLAIDFKTAEVVHDALMSSPSHRRNIVNSRYNNVGIAVLHGELDGRETILLVQFFGTRREDTAPVLVANPSEPAEPAPSRLPSSGPSVAGQALAETTAQNQAEALDQGVSNAGVIVVDRGYSGIQRLTNIIVKYSDIFFIAFLIFLIISLLINIIVKIRVQHSSVILQSVAVVAIILALLFSKTNFLAEVGTNLMIL